MSHLFPRVHVIVAGDFGERLRDLPLDEPVWVADTPSNHPVLRSIWAARPADIPRTLAGITSFQVAESQLPEDWLLGILGTIQLHHGEYSQSPPYSELRVIGTALTPRLRSELSEYDFADYEDLPDGFVAHKRPA